MVVIEIVVSTTFGCEAQEVHHIRLGVLLVVVETVVTPIPRIGKRTCHKCRQTVFVIFQLEESAFLHHKSVVIAENNIAYTQFLITPVGIGRMYIILRIHISTLGVEIIGTAEKIGNLIAVYTFIITVVHTTVEVKVLPYLSGIGGKQSVPVVTVVGTCRNHGRTVLARTVNLFDGSIVERSVTAAESVVQRTFISPSPRGIGIGREFRIPLT